MNPYQFTSCCDVCGGEGPSREPWHWGYAVHTHKDPRVCQRVLARKEREECRKNIEQQQEYLKEFSY